MTIFHIVGLGARNNAHRGPGSVALNQHTELQQHGNRAKTYERQRFMGECMLNSSPGLFVHRRRAFIRNTTEGSTVSAEEPRVGKVKRRAHSDL